MLIFHKKKYDMDSYCIYNVEEFYYANKMHINCIGITQFFSHIIQRKTQIMFSLYLVFEEKTCIVLSKKKHNTCM
jgi:hypothetical protein